MTPSLLPPIPPKPPFLPSLPSPPDLKHPSKMIKNARRIAKKSKDELMSMQVEMRNLIEELQQNDSESDHEDDDYQGDLQLPEEEI